MMPTRVAVVGGGIVGVAVASRLLQMRPGWKVSVLEKEDGLGLHQTGHNSGVVHAGIYYQPGSLKAKLCRRGVHLLRQFCAEHDVPYDEIGKVVVALDSEEREALSGILDRALKNGVPDVRIVDRGGLRQLEPFVEGVGAIHSPRTAIVDFGLVTRRMAEVLVSNGGEVVTRFEVARMTRSGSRARLHAKDGREGEYDLVFLCSGLQSDRVTAMVGGYTGPTIVPFRGEYYLLKAERRDLVRGLVYPVPDPRYPFLGVHITPRIDGEVMIGPNAVLALSREGYRWGDVSGRDLAELASSPGFYRFAAQHWRTGMREVLGSLSSARFVASARRYVPDIADDDILPGPSGVRAQALERDGSLVDDFRLVKSGPVVSVVNAPSPAATSSMAIAEHVVDIALSA